MRPRVTAAELPPLSAAMVLLTAVDCRCQLHFFMRRPSAGQISARFTFPATRYLAKLCFKFSFQLFRAASPSDLSRYSLGILWNVARIRLCPCLDEIGKLPTAKRGNQYAIHPVSPRRLKSWPS
jgi:hypothetical protein